MSEIGPLKRSSLPRNFDHGWWRARGEACVPSLVHPGAGATLAAVRPCYRLARRPGRVMDEAVLDLVILDGEQTVLEYRSRAAAAANAHGPMGEPKTALLAAINGVRAQGKLAPLVLDVRQSEANGRLAGTLLDATFKNRGADADRIALGMLAGWDVDGTIRKGGMFVGLVAPAHDVATWLDFVLERPFGRIVLLDPDARRIAIAPTIPRGPPGIGAVVTTYALFESSDHQADTNRAVERVTAARRVLGRAPLARLQSVPTLVEPSRRVLAGASEPGAALQAAIDAVAGQVVGARVYGYVVEANDLDRAPVPDWILAEVLQRITGLSLQAFSARTGR